VLTFSLPNPAYKKYLLPVSEDHSIHHHAVYREAGDFCCYCSEVDIFLAQNVMRSRPANLVGPGNAVDKHGLYQRDKNHTLQTASLMLFSFTKE
jgi:hypothetical protein